jgi:EAL domain-containing protein (putative c-di-GMP-specific phosphodiesterase class I)
MPAVRPIPPFRIAFQPIVDVETGITVAQEALVRGQGGEGAGVVLGMVAPEDRYRVDAAIRAAAVAEALRLGLLGTTAALTLNFYPGAAGDGEFGLDRTVTEAERMGFPLDRLVFEVSETEPVADPAALGATLSALQRRGLRIALDDVGTGHARMPLLLVWRPDGAKLAREVVCGLDLDAARHEAVRGTLAQLHAFGLVPVAEGIETEGEYRALRALGVRAMQGYLFARPALDRLPVPQMPGD